jgi:hypothetical protein
LSGTPMPYSRGGFDSRVLKKGTRLHNVRTRLAVDRSWC